MKRIGIVGLCLAAVFAFSAMAASSASAAGLLLARVPGGGSVAGVTFLSFVSLPLLTTHGGSLIHCKHATNHGLFLSPTLGDILIRFLGCTTANPLGGRLQCSTLNAGTEEIHLPLATTLFHLGLAHLTLTVGRIPAAVILLDKHVKIECGGVATILVLGAVIGALQLDEPNEKPIPLNTPFSTALLNFQQTTPTSHGLQHLRLFLFEDELRTYDLHSITTTLTEGPVELSAEVALALLDLFRLSNGNHVSIELFENP
ncbi:MAG TPA: hypothetical protein VGZ72_15275 [Stellaceae bacterium]|nr:hypothetical protein [Stellaceae bacterium]